MLTLRGSPKLIFQFKWLVNNVRSISTLNNLPKEQKDPILGLASVIKADPNPNKVNLTVGIYKDDSGTTPIFSSVQQAISKIHNKSLAYLPILGSVQYTSLVKKFLFQESMHVEPQQRYDDIVTVQTFSGTGALAVCAHFLKTYTNKKILLPNITWGNHKNIYTKSGFEEIQPYRYYNKDAPQSVDVEGMLADMEKFAAKNSVSSSSSSSSSSFSSSSATGKGLSPRSCVLVHACCHNPTGLDPTPEQWDRIFAKIHELQLVPIVDMAYQGLTTGNLVEDVAFLGKHINKYPWEHGFYLCQSFAKNLGLYGERIGSLSMVLPPNVTKPVRENIMLGLERVVRSQYSSPGIHGQEIVTHVLANKELKQQWFADVEKMHARINGIRKLLHEKLKHIPNFANVYNEKTQHGMFYFSNLEKPQIAQLRELYSIYLTEDGRISLSGLNSKNMDYVCKAIEKVTAK